MCAVLIQCIDKMTDHEKKVLPAGPACKAMYILTYSMLKNREAWIALESHQEGTVTSASAVPRCEFPQKEAKQNQFHEQAAATTDGIFIDVDIIEEIAIAV